MEPMLRQDRDLVVIRIPFSRLRKYDVALYKRGDSYVLHRVIAVKNDHYLIRGDNTYGVERVPDTAVIGVLDSFTHKGRKCRVTDKGYRLYVHVWQLIYPIRFALFFVKRLAVKMARKMGILSFLKRVLQRGGGK